MPKNIYFQSKMRNAFLLLLLILFTASFSWQVERRMSLSVMNKVIRDGKVVSISSEIHYHFDRGTLAVHYHQPFEYYLLSDSKGEVRLYYPSKNEVFLSRDPSQITDQSLLYYFLSNRVSDLGLRDMGFTLFKTTQSKGVVSTWWSPPANLAKNLQKVEMVHENHRPIYMAYHHQNKITRKVFYYNYTSDPNLPLSIPQKILEYNYLSDGDSLISQMSFTNILFGSKATSPLFEFKIPTNAKVVEK